MRTREKMSAITRMLLLRSMFIRHGLLLILGSCFHIILLIPQQNNEEVFGTEGVLMIPFEYWLCGTLLLGCAGFLVQSLVRMYRHAHGQDLSSISGLSDIFFFSVFPLPLYLLTFPSHVFTSFLGLSVCVMQGCYVVFAGTDMRSRLQSLMLGQSQREKKMELLVTPDRLLLCMMSLIGLFFLLVQKLTAVTELSEIQSNMLRVYALTSFLGMLLLEWNVFRFLLRRAKQKATRAWQLNLAYALPWSFWCAFLALIFTITCLFHPDLRKFCYWGIFLHLLCGYLFLRRILERPNLVWKWLLENPGQMLIFSFLGLILCGAAFLNLPICSNTGESIGILNSLFTATSAVCVTGLSVMDIATALSPTGKVALAVLIQLGGLGIMSLTSFIAMLLGQKLGLFGNAAMRQSVGEEHSRNAKSLLAVIMLGTFLVEFSGAALLTRFYQHQFGWDFLQSAGYGSFMSISAFCNAGFSLHTDNLVIFVHQPFMLMVIAWLLLTGGFGFTILLNIFKNLTDRRKMPLGIYERMVLWTTFLLCIGGSLLFFLFEKDTLLAPLSWSDQLFNAFFHTVSPRTAGFNSLDMSNIQSSTRVLLMTLMFIGGNSASTAGGVKVGTTAVMFMALRTWLRGETRVVICKRAIPDEIIRQAATVLLLTGGIVLGGTLLLTFLMPDAPLQDVFFEVVSAIGTVGLSTGLTSHLTPAGQLLIIVLMFLGRVGPVTFLLTLHTAKSGKVNYPATRYLIG